ncbi:MAG: peroxiredoxin-like family protein [Planctomycetota bacterium]
MIARRLMTLGACSASGLLALSGCGTSESPSSSGAPDAHQPEVTSVSTPTESLQARLDARRAEFSATASEALKITFNEGVREVGESGVLDSAKKVGDAAPNFTLPNAVGESVELASLLEQGPVVLTWYRGGWCPYCNIQLAAYQEILGDFKALGAHLVAISPETPDHSLDTKQKNELEFHVLSDVGHTVAASYGLAYTLPQGVQDAFKGRLDLPAFNGDDSWQLPLSATYVIDRAGVVRYAFLDADYRIRAEPAAVLEAVRALD